ncbi:MAG: AAA family ATPase [Patescibacteria group bacterium]|nr:AAA family ATPase [Patescibacteria group bacterium]
MVPARLVLIGGPSGAGKTTICTDLERRGFWRKLITVTTRAPRPRETDGVDYRFRTPEQFAVDDAAGLLCERTEYIGNGVAYGIYKADVDDMVVKGGRWYCITDANAAHQLRPLVPDIVSIYLMCEKQELRTRLAGRGDSPDEIERRLARYDDEVATHHRFDASVNVTHCSPGYTGEVVRYHACTLVPRQATAIRFVYVSGPFSSDPEAGTNAAIDAAEQLARAGYEPFIPHLTREWDRRHPHPYEFWMDRDLAQLARCDALVRLPGHSPGADREVAWAHAHGIPVYIMEELLQAAFPTGIAVEQEG